eukprot:scaffold244_cov172-Amphora_coffeaeformis.AAC.51
MTFFDVSDLCDQSVMRMLVGSPFTLSASNLADTLFTVGGSLRPRFPRRLNSRNDWDQDCDYGCFARVSFL